MNNYILKILDCDSKYNDIGLALLRVVPGLLMFFNHGLGKISSGTDRWNRLGHALTDIIGLEFLSVFFGFMASFAESICALFIVLGFLARPSSFLLLFTMVVASLHHIIDGDFSELALIYALISLVIMINGSGKYSIDKYLFDRINKT